MSFAQNPSNIGQLPAEEFFRNPAQAMRLALQNQGMDVRRNYLARRALDRANELQPLSTLYGVGETNFLDFANQYARSMFQSGGGPFGAGQIQQRLTQSMQNPSSEFYNFMTEGDPEEQFQRLNSLQTLASRGMNPYLLQARQRVAEGQFGDWWNQMLQGRQVAPNWWEATGGGVNLGGSLPGYTPPSGGVTPGNPQTPGAPGAVQPGAPGSPQNPGAPAPAQPATNAYTDWNTAYSALMQGHDPRNLMTSGFQAPGRAFSFGGVSYNPAAANATGRTDRDPNSRFGGGAAWQGFVYRMQSLIQRQQKIRQTLAQGGQVPPELQGEVNKTTEQLARDAAQWVNSRWNGNTGLTITG